MSRYCTLRKAFRFSSNELKYFEISRVLIQDYNTCFLISSYIRITNTHEINFTLHTITAMS